MREETLKVILLRAGAALAVAFCLLPLLWMVFVSVSGDIKAVEVGHWTFTLGHYREVLSAGSLHVLDYLRNSLIISSLSALLTTLVGALAAYAVARLAFPGKMALILSAVALSMFPQISIVGHLFKIMRGLGWTNTHQALVLPYVSWSLPLALWVLVSYFSAIPRDIDKAAMVDGASRWQIFTRILVPLALPGLLSTFLIVFIFCYNEFLFALMLTSDFRARTLPVGIALFQGLHGEVPFGSVMAAATIASVPVVLLAVAFQRRIVEGLTRGAVKG